MKSKKLFSPDKTRGVPEISAETLFPHLGKVKLVDVRSSEEFTGELGHIPGSELVTLGEDLLRFLKHQAPEEEIVFICKSGIRSATACQIGFQFGLMSVMNLQGGMVRWNELKYPTEK